MATQAQIDANRINAQKSTGPRTEEGKARVRRNTTRHGLCSTIVLMAGEEALDQAFKQLLADLCEEHQPQGPTEDILVYKMAESFFSTNRAQELLVDRLSQNLEEFPFDQTKQVDLMLRYHTTADRAFNKNLADLRKLQNERRKEEKEEIGFVSQNTPKQPQLAKTNPLVEPTEIHQEPLPHQKSAA